MSECTLKEAIEAEVDWWRGFDTVKTPPDACECGICRYCHMKKKKRAIKGAVLLFRDQMEDRMFDKADGGFDGWNHAFAPAWRITARLHEKAAKVLVLNDKVEAKELIDIANFCMMLYHSLPMEEGGNE